jgi:hypothetical protein
MSEHTHEGWFWFCPILATLDGRDGIEVEARWAWLEPVFSFCEGLEATRIWLSELMIPDYEPSFMFKLRKRQ